MPTIECGLLGEKQVCPLLLMRVYAFYLAKKMFYLLQSCSV